MVRTYATSIPLNKSKSHRIANLPIEKHHTAVLSSSKVKIAYDLLREDEKLLQNSISKFSSSADIGELQENQVNADLELLQDPLHRFRRAPKISATDFSAQVWCEKQLEFTLLTGKKRTTVAMKKGVERHEQLEKLDHEVIYVTPTLIEEELGLKILNSAILFEQLLHVGKVREIWIAAVIDDILIRGVIDEVEIIHTDSKTIQNASDSNQAIVIRDTKTRQVEKEPSYAQKRTSAVQLQVYRWIVDQLQKDFVDFDKIFQIYECDPLQNFELPELKPFINLQALTTYYKSILKLLPPLLDEMEIIYEYNGKKFSKNSIPYDEQSVMATMEDLLDWWRGRRPTEGVLSQESWKCKNCIFLSECSSTYLPRNEIDEILKTRRLEEDAVLQSDSNMDQGTQVEGATEEPPFNMDSK